MSGFLAYKASATASGLQIANRASEPILKVPNVTLVAATNSRPPYRGYKDARQTVPKGPLFERSGDDNEQDAYAASSDPGHTRATPSGSMRPGTSASRLR